MLKRYNNSDTSQGVSLFLTGCSNRRNLASENLKFTIQSKFNPVLDVE